MYYFISDTHLGIDGELSSKRRESLLVEWLSGVSDGAKAIFLVGDIFDFWFEYKRVVPKGHTRLLGKLSELTDRGVEIHFFLGNHDKWAGEYLAHECGVVMHREPTLFELYGRRVFVAHGDNMSLSRGPLERLMQWAFHSRTVIRLFSALVHPNVAIKFGEWWSRKSRKSSGYFGDFRGEDECLVRYARAYQESEQQRADFFVFGHIHLAKRYELGEGAEIIFLGEWLNSPIYAQMSSDGEIELKEIEFQREASRKMRGAGVIE